jgi:hypothetical protein
MSPSTSRAKLSGSSRDMPTSPSATLACPHHKLLSVEGMLGVRMGSHGHVPVNSHQPKRLAPAETHDALQRRRKRETGKWP